MFIRKTDGSVETQDGRVVLFSVERFISDIAEGDKCFICGASRASKDFNDEHVIPDWILRRLQLHSGRIVMPNGGDFMYGRYVMPCCVGCNTEMSTVFEAPISDAFSSGYMGVRRFVESGNGPLLVTWLALIFLKTYLKHKELRWNQDRRLGDRSIAELHDWTELHHIHCLVRSFYSGAVVMPNVYGSLLIVPASLTEETEHFDYGDFLPGKSILLRLGDVAILAVLNDSRFVLGVMDGLFRKLGGPMTVLQLRELMIKMAHNNMRLDPRPQYYSEIDLNTEEYVIAVNIPTSVDLAENPGREEYGKMMDFSVGGILQAKGADPELIRNVREGNLTFLFGDDGKFLSHQDG